MILGNNYIRDIKLGNKRVELAIGNIPALKYKRLDYISSTATGGQYIDLGCKLFENTDEIQVEIKFKIKGKGKDNDKQSVLLGANDESQNNIWPGMLLRTTDTTKSNEIQFKTKNVKFNCYVNNVNYTSYVQNGNYYIYECPTYMNNIYDLKVITTTWNSNSTHSKNTTLFCGLDSNNTPFRYSISDLYYLKLYKNGQLVRDLIPVQRISDDEAGLLDLANSVFYPSQGDESFVAGYHYDHEIEYLESTGDQWINLDYSVWNGGLSGEIMLQRLNSDTSQTVFIGRKAADGFNLYSKGNGIIGLWIGGSQSTSIESNNTLTTDTEIHNIIFDINNSGTAYLSIDGNEYSNNYYLQDGTTSAIQLFSHRGYYNTIGRIYSCKLWFKGTMIYDLIPVRKDGIGYMYDKLSDNLFGNSSSSSTPFILGPDI